MPLQVCANGLHLSPVPPELQNLSDLECKIGYSACPFYGYILYVEVWQLVKSRRWLHKCSNNFETDSQPATLYV